MPCACDNCRGDGHCRCPRRPSNVRSQLDVFVLKSHCLQYVQQKEDFDGTPEWQQKKCFAGMKRLLEQDMKLPCTLFAPEVLTCSGNSWKHSVERPVRFALLFRNCFAVLSGVDSLIRIN